MRGAGRDRHKDMTMKEMETNPRNAAGAGNIRCGSSNRGRDQFLLLLITAGAGGGEDSMELITS